MQAFTQTTGIVAPIDRPNVDTDAIIPKQFLKSIKRSGFGRNLFDEWRYLDIGQPDEDCSNRPTNDDFILNQPDYKDACILIARENFGCGSSREHAVWALTDYGFNVVIAPSFADIFFSNCGKNGLLAITLDEATIDQLFSDVIATPGYQLSIDLDSQMITMPSGEEMHFDIDGGLKHRLLNGLDDIGITLNKHANEISAYEEKLKVEKPWLIQ